MSDTTFLKGTEVTKEWLNEINDFYHTLFAASTTAAAARTALGVPSTTEAILDTLVTTTGDMIYASSASTPARLAIGTARQQLATNAGATAPEWVSSMQSLMTTTGDTLHASSANTPARLAIGAAGAISMVASGLPSWLAIGTARQVPTVNAGATALAYANPITLTASQATTSGTAFDFTGIPAGVRRITVQFSEVSLSGTDDVLVQLGDAGGPETGTYVSSSAVVSDGAASVVRASTSGFIVIAGGSGNILTGTIVINLFASATFAWIAAHSGKISTTICICGGGSKSLSAELDQVRVTRSGTDTFDSGAVTITYE